MVNLKNEAKRFIKKIIRITDNTHALTRLFEKGIEINTVIDIGASNGAWSIEAKRFWKNAHYHMIDANAAHEQDLKILSTNDTHYSYIITAAGDTCGTIYFDASALFGGGAMKEKPIGKPCIEVPVTTIDHEVQKNNLKGPYFIKLDTHGFEIPILNGAEATLQEAAIVVIETYNFRLTPDTLLFYEMCQWMAEKGFRIADISDPIWRKSDKMLWQIDLYFVRADRTEFKQEHFV